MTAKPKHSRLEKTLSRFAVRIAEWFTAPAKLWLFRTIKAAAIVLTAPATFEVAYTTTGSLAYALAALVLVETVLISGWHMLDSHKDATTAERWLYTALAGVAYAVTWIVAVAHHEHYVGIAFRLTLGVALAYSVVMSGVLASIKLERRTERDISQDRKVRHKRKSAERSVAILEIAEWERARMEAIRPGYYSTKQYGRVGAWLLDMRQSRAAEGLPGNAYQGKSLSRINAQRSANRAARLAQIPALIADNAGLVDTELVKLIAQSFGVSERTAWADFREVRNQALGANGRH